MKILFIGNSHTYFNDMPQLMADMYRELTGAEAEITMLAYSGRGLDWHNREYFSARFNLLYGHYDYCIIQQKAHPFPEKEMTMEQGQRLIRLCQSVGTAPVLYMTWAEKIKPENQQAMIDVYTELAEKTGACLAPVGRIWQIIQQKHPEIELYWEDGEHASPYGDYLAAATICCTLTGKSPLALSSKGRDYLQGQPLDFKAAHAIEDAEKVPVQLKETACTAIRQAVQQVLFI